jgi:hypothetical protein
VTEERLDEADVRPFSTMRVAHALNSSGV